jgi:hypothetical protein
VHNYDIRPRKLWLQLGHHVSQRLEVLSVVTQSAVYIRDTGCTQRDWPALTARLLDIKVEGINVATRGGVAALQNEVPRNAVLT